MSLNRAKGFGDLYAEVRGNDLVLAAGPPLASALNHRVEQAHFDPFAIAPRRLTAGRQETAEDWYTGATPTGENPVYL